MKRKSIITAAFAAVFLLYMATPASSFWMSGKYTGPSSTGKRLQTTTNSDGSLTTICDPNPSEWCVYDDPNGNLWLGDDGIGGPSGPGPGDPYYATVVSVPQPS